jgi:carboxylesterase
MPQPAHLNTDAFFFPGGPVGILLIHGFTGSPAETRPLGEFLAARGLTVSGVRLPGHGTVPDDLMRTHRREWIAACEAELAALRDRCQTLFVGGLSLGGLLALWLGAQHADLAGLLLLAPGIKVRDWRIYLTPLVQYFVKYVPPGTNAKSDLCDPQAAGRVWCYDVPPVAGAAQVLGMQRQVRGILPRVDQPVLIVQGRHDTALTPDAAQIVHDYVGSTDRTLVWLEKSGHNLLVDGERERVWEECAAWIAERT